MLLEVPGVIAEVEDAEAGLILSVLKELTGITIPMQKKMMVVFRLRKRLADLQHPSLADYVARVRRDRKEQQLFINLLTTNETSFFRTPRVWKFFREEFLPEFVTTRGSETLRAWSAASSTGEEASSIAMSCHDMQLRHPSFKFQIQATDVDTEVLAKAESGKFGAKTAEKLRVSHPEMFQRHFKASGPGSYEMDSQMRRNMKFATHNLMEQPRLAAPQDIVFLRNVLIYFQEAEQKVILNRLGSAMKSGSILVLGESESLSSIATSFAFVQPQIYRKGA